MIGSLGIQKITTLLVLVALLAFIYGYGVMTLGAKNTKIDQELRANQSEFSEITTNIEDLRTGIKKFSEQKNTFEKLSDLGFFDSQNRLEMRRRFNDMQEKSRLISARYSISPANVEENKKATEAGYEIRSTIIDFTLEAIEDVDIFKFIYLLNYGFPGQVSIEGLSISRDVDITPTLLQKIGSGELVAVIGATMRVNLRTMVKNPAAQAKRLQEEGGVEE